MIDLNRKKNHKWIMQKNVSSKDIITAYLEVISNKKAEIDYKEVKQELKNQSIYHGRSDSGSINTMGVRFSQMCFYMFGYKIDKFFVPSQMTQNLLSANPLIKDEANSLINLFSMQFPNPYSRTNDDFVIYAGRLFIKLLLEERIEKRLYIDEIIWFLPFIDRIDEVIYNELVDSINEYRKLTFEEKDIRFKNIPDYDDVFSNVTHEMNYYFLRIFKGFGVLDIIPDRTHNNGKLFKFHHGTGTTYRSDAYDSGKKFSGYVQLNTKIINEAIELNSKFSTFDTPTTMQTYGIFSKRDWLTALYETEPLSYMVSIINEENEKSDVRLTNEKNKIEKIKNVSDTINKMIYASKYGSRDGKEFEDSLKPVIELFRETRNVEIISGSGNTDLLCAMEGEDLKCYKINIDAKTRKNAVEDINARRLKKHLDKNGSEFCIVVAPRFASGTDFDIQGYNIVTIKAEDLGAYCYKECLNSYDVKADFESIHKIICANYGSDITKAIRNLTIQRYGIIV